jgi:hypothetical protein
MSVAVGSLGVQEESSGAATAERVGLDEPPTTIVVKLDTEVVSGGEAHGLQRYPDAPGGDGGWWRPLQLVSGSR